MKPALFNLRLAALLAASTALFAISTSAAAQDADDGGEIPLPVETVEDSGADGDPDPEEPIPVEEAPVEVDEDQAELRTGADEAEDDEDDEAEDEAEEGEAEEGDEPTEPTIARRELPDYDGRAEPGPDAGEVLLWVPRILFFPIHLVFEYVIRQPLGWFLTTAERENWTALLIDFFTFEERRAGLVPTAFFDFGFQPSVGLFFWHNAPDVLEGNFFRVSAAFGGIDWLRGTISDRLRLSEETELGLTFDALHRPDFVYQGTGYDSERSQRSRYRRDYLEGRLDFRFMPWRESEVRFRAGVIWNQFAPDGYNWGRRGDPTLQQAVDDQGWYELPPGFEGYTAYRQRLDVVIDTREPRPAAGHGVRVEAYTGLGFDLNDPVENRWIQYGGAIGGFLDVGANRIFGLYGLARFADPLGTAPVPWLEQVNLGGDPMIMSGFIQNQLVDRSALVATLEYRYPVWVWLDGSLHFSVGNVFEERLSNFHVERLRMSFGFGLRSIGDRDQSFNILLAFGSEPFDQGAQVSSVRLLVGSQQGF